MLFQNEMGNEGSRGGGGAGRDLNSYEEKIQTVFKLMREKNIYSIREMDATFKNLS